MHECLRCGKACEGVLFCDSCQAALLQRSQQDERAFFSTPVPQVQVTELSQQESTEQDCTIQMLRSSSSAMVGKQQDRQRQEWESVQIGDDWPQAEQASFSTMPVPMGITPSLRIQQARQLRLRRLRRAFITLALFAIAVLVVDCVLVSLVFTRHRTSEAATHPMLTFSPGIVYPGQLARLQLHHFSPSARVLLRRNVDEAVRLDTEGPFLRVDANGEADVRVLVEDSWGTGNQYIEAEDVDAHYVAGVAVQVIGAGPTLPPHLQLSSQDINLGADGQGANTLKSVTLQNSGAGRISWTAWSNQPWLVLTPTQGTFSAHQRVTIAANRSRLQAGKYEGSVTFVSNMGEKLPLHVKMTVLRAWAEARPMLVVTPPALSFVATDGGRDPGEQTLTISNPGKRPLNWSFAHAAPTISVDQQMPLVDKMDWLDISPRQGMLKPGGSISLHPRVHSHNLLPSVYSGILTFNGGNALNDPQPVAVSLTVQPRCGITTSIGSLSFTTVAGQQPTGQPLVLSTASECTSDLSWQASSLARWLTITPTRGRVNAQSPALATVQVKAAGLAPDTYTSFLVFLSEQRTQTVAVQLTILAPGAQPAEDGQASAADATATNAAINTNGSDDAPSLALSSLNLTFRIMQGDANPPAQSVTMANTGGGLLYWQAREDAAGQPWLKISPGTGSLFAGQTKALLLNVDGSSLEPGTYRSSVVVTATDEAGVQVNGSPQTLVVTLKVVQPCTLHISPTSLSFSASLLSGEPADEYIKLESIGGCSHPIAWQATVDTDSQAWLHLSATSGNDIGNSTVLTVRVSTNGTLLGFNRGQITFQASDRFGTALRNSSQTVNVTFSIIG